MLRINEGTGMTNQTVAFIGIGAMGGPMARRLQAAGYELTVCDRNVAAVAAFAGSGARAARCPAECAGADVIVVLVSSGQQVRDVILGEDGLLSGFTGRNRAIVVVMSTVSAEVLEKIAKVLPATVRLVDAPISGGTRGAEQGTLTILTAGDHEDVEALKPVFDHLGAQRIYCGRLGSAQTIKIINNVFGCTITAIAGETYRLAIERGLEPALVSQVLEACSGRNVRSRDPAGPQAGFVDLAKDRMTCMNTEGIMRKDLGLAVEMASRTKGAYPTLTALKALMDSLGDETFENWRLVANLPPATD